MIKKHTSQAITTSIICTTDKAEQGFIVVGV